MKNNVVRILLSAIIFSTACRHSSGRAAGEREYVFENDIKNTKTATLQIIDSAVFNIGRIRTGQKITHVFRFRNTGKAPLVIGSATATCGCTVADYPRKPILVDGEDSITAYFDSGISGKGLLNKVITVTSNSSTSPDLLTLIGDVK